MEPISFVDQLVKGVVLATYDFARLTWVGFAIPFISKRPRFWTTALSIQTRLSSLTHLVLWVLLTVSIGSRTGADVASSVAGLAKGTGRDIPTTILLALLVSMLVDLAVRISFSLFRFRVRRQLYGDLARIAAANMFFGACLIMLAMTAIEKSDWIAQIAPIRFLWPVGWWLPNPLIFLFCISLAVIVVRAFAIKERARRGFLGAALVLAVPIIFIKLAIPMYHLVQNSLAAISPIVEEKVEIQSAFPQCEFRSERIHVTTDLMVRGADTYLIQSHNFAIYKVDDEVGHGEAYVGRPNDDQSGVILLRDKYVHIDLIADYRPATETIKRPEGKFLCTLKLIVGWTDQGLSGNLPQSVEDPSRK